ncbi:hypothetical protein EVAR_74581_1 [Eumeta japonica]|uniref:Uncharacterized protein n=1 Tax=Eumeta variegata TaxID=151549 RepID=A0A4C1TCY4_EUMVA|nr:hypothetical protein EVAR_74581_1 [Eumeta japonica]
MRLSAAVTVNQRRRPSHNPSADGVISLGTCRRCGTPGRIYYRRSDDGRRRAARLCFDQYSHFEIIVALSIAGRERTASHLIHAGRAARDARHGAAETRGAAAARIR